MYMSRRTLVTLALLSSSGRSPAQSPSDARVKARLALALARFTQWPTSAFNGPDEPLLLCVLNRSDTLALAFDELSGQTVAGRPIRIIHSPDRSFSGCHALFVHESAERRAPGVNSVLSSLGSSPVLTIGDAEGFCLRGGMVELVNVNDAMRLDVNLKSLRVAQLSLSSQVLKLARQIRE
jgi:YfiR/HmsC-like